jgi:hypothetical protein
LALAVEIAQARVEAEYRAIPKPAEPAAAAIVKPLPFVAPAGKAAPVAAPAPPLPEAPTLVPTPKAQPALPAMAQTPPAPPKPVELKSLPAVKAGDLFGHAVVALESHLDVLSTYVDGATAGDSLPEGVRRKVYVARAIGGGDPAAQVMVSAIREDLAAVSTTHPKAEEDLPQLSEESRRQYFDRERRSGVDVPRAKSWLPVQVVEDAPPVIVAETIDTPTGWLVSMAVRGGVVYESRFHKQADGMVMRTDYRWQWNASNQKFESTTTQENPRALGKINLRWAFEKELEKIPTYQGGRTDKEKWGSENALPGRETEKTNGTETQTPNLDKPSKAGLFFLPIFSLLRLKIRPSRYMGVILSSLSLLLAALTGSALIFSLIGAGVTMIMFTPGLSRAFAFAPSHKNIRSRADSAA